MAMNLNKAVQEAVGSAIHSSHPLSGGCIGDVYHVTLEDKRDVVVKVDNGRHAKLDIEGYMLQYLADQSQLPVPEVLFNSPNLLIMSYIEGDSHFSGGAEQHAAELLADLHQQKGKAHGLEKATLIGGLHQPNDWTDSWITFFAEQRLLYMAREAVRESRMPKQLYTRIQAFSDRLGDFIQEPAHPALLHGDVWTTNVLAKNGKITGFIDPAVYYGHPEIELAFVTLFSTFGSSFFERYQALSPIAPGFFEERRDIYNLYPLLVHVRLFGGGYLASVERTISRLGF